MFKHKAKCGVIVLLLSSIIILFSSCKKDADPTADISYLTFSVPRLELKHDLYFRLDHDARSVELVFDLPLDTTTVAGNILFSDQTGPLVAEYDLTVHDNIVLISFHNGFVLKDGWRYHLNLKTGLKSESGLSLAEDENIDIRTTGKHIAQTIKNKAADERFSIASISDIHCGDSRAIAGNYCWFGQNVEAMESFLDFILANPQVKELVIQGDLFDEWLIPYTVNPFDPLAGINDSREYFLAIANADTNKTVFNKFRAIAAFQDIDLVYIPGNHDMLLTREVIEEIIPGIKWKGGAKGLGKYEPEAGIIMEHGHRYDFFNCPQTLVNPGHMLPPGFFVSRLYAAGMAGRTAYSPVDGNESKGSAEFNTAWSLAFIYTIADFGMPMPQMNQPNVLMGGIDKYTDPFSFNGAQDMYAANIEDLWPITQDSNRVPVPIDVFAAIYNGVDLYAAALEEYMIGSPSLSPYKVVSFGHSHKPMLMVHPPGDDYTSIYANSGSWIDEDQSSKKVRTFLLINPGSWTGSELDVVMLYQYNLSNNDDYTPLLLAEENIEVGK